MSTSLLEQLPGIVAAGRRHAAWMLEQVEGGRRVALRTRELVHSGAATLAEPLATGSGWAAASTRPHPRSHPADEPNRLIRGDNLPAMAALLVGGDGSPSLRGAVDLIYIDPPFGSKANYRATIALPGPAEARQPRTLERFAYSDTWSTASYLAMITPRLALMRELLADTGSIYVHLDWHVGHYVKIVMDELFGSSNFVNEIVWRYGKMSNATRRYPQNHDILLYYAKRPGYFFAPVRAASSEYRARFGRFVVADKVHYGAVRNSADRLIQLRARKVEKEMGRPLTDDDVLFDFTKEFKTQDDVFTDISIIKGNAAENLRFDTQKPEKLVARLVEASAPPGGVVADFFAGSGTTAAVAERLGRRWIACDIGEPAITVTRRRLVELGAAPFLHQTVEGHPAKLARARHGRPVRAAELTTAALIHFGAQPLPPAPPPPSAPSHGPGEPPIATPPPRPAGASAGLGQLPGTRTLVFADRPAQLTTVATLRRAQRCRDSGGFARVVVLGWSFPPDFGRQIVTLDDPHLEVLAIPPDLPALPDGLAADGGRSPGRGPRGRLRKESGGGSGRPLGRDGPVRFAGFGFLQARVVARKEVDWRAQPGEEMCVELVGYRLLSPGATGLDDRNHVALRQVTDAEPLALLEYWAVDPDYDGEVFRSVWQDYRRCTCGGPHHQRVSTSARMRLPVKQGSRRVCIRGVDVVGAESEVVIDGVDLDR